MAKSQFGVVGPHTSRSYVTDLVVPAGVAVVPGVNINSVALPAAQGVRALGVTALATQNPGDPVPVVEVGEVTGIAAVAIARGQWVWVNDATGQFAPCPAALGNEVVGLALEAAVNPGDEFLLLVLPQRV